MQLLGVLNRFGGLGAGMGSAVRAAWAALAPRRRRFKAWWDGVDPPPEPPAAETVERAAGTSEESAAPATPASGWPARFLAPVARLVEPLVQKLVGRLSPWWEAQAPRRRRLKDWWDGVKLEAPPEQAAEPSPSPAKAASPAPAPPAGEDSDHWSTPRIKVSELIWGDGFSFPGGVEHAVAMVKPLGLNKEKSMLDLGCGLGGATRAIHKTLGVWVLGMDASKAMAKAGMEASERAGLGKRAPIQLYEPATMQLPAGKYDAVFARQQLSLVADKKRMISQLTQSLKPDGQLMLTDFVLAKRGSASPALETWRAGEDQLPHVGFLDEIIKELKTLKLDVRVAEDLSAEFRTLVTAGWQGLAARLVPGALSPEDSEAMTKEVSAWERRIAAMDAGELRFARVYAIRLG